VEVNKIYQGNCLEVIKTFPDESIDCCVTSPPYYALRDYQTGKWEGGDPECSHMRDSKTSHCNTGQKNVEGSIGDGIFKSVCPKCGAVCVDEQIGLEESPEAYIEKLVVLSREVRRILKPTGTLWLNLGDSYQSGNGKVTGQTMSKGTSRENAHVLEKKLDMDRIKESGLKQKDLIGIPWMAAFALRKDGWYLRQEIIWAKGSCMPECLIPSTSIFIKQEGLILKRNLQFIYDNKNKLGNIEILSPSGWKKY
jgi:site-specific DNA-methyltransferase (cytosine-N4-specific)